MKNASITINFTPTEENLSEIFSWTTFPKNNWSVIRKCFEKNNLCVAIIQNETVGFFAYKLEAVCIFIIIAETKESHRNCGVAKIIKKAIEKKFKNSDYKAMHLYCAPKSSQFAWKKLGFEYYPENASKNNDDQIYMFSIFGDVLQLSSTNYEMLNNDNTIEIWNSQFPRNTMPNWFSNIDFKDDKKTLLKPLLLFGNDEWKVSIKYNGNCFEGRYKDFDRRSEVYECFYIGKIK